ncbi:MAG: abiGI [Bacillales bacterium]|jgi:hypothetical protein|nr:abiGI [Bacillales bacterium]
MPNYTIEAMLSDDYAQSANTLFHFVKKFDYLKNILTNKAIVPRYCVENIDYLNIQVDNEIVKKIAVLQKCFCDIPIHKITTVLSLKGIGENFEKLTLNEKSRAEKYNTHTDFYGEYAIAFSKKWGEKNNLQPIQYLNSESFYTNSFVSAFKQAVESDDLLNEVADDINNRLAFIKPLRGTMQRQFQRDNSDNVTVASKITIEFIKNFHDEQEWRFIPETKTLECLDLEQIIADSNIIDSDYLNQINSGLKRNKYNTIWLKYRYEDVRYIIVPDSRARMNMINTILGIDKSRFETHSAVDIQKQLMISKILVLDEIRRDW